MQRGDILGHEFMGEVVAVAQKNGLKEGDRVVVPFPIGRWRAKTHSEQQLRPLGLRAAQGPGGFIQERLKTSARVNETIKASQKNPARTTIRVRPGV